MPVSSHSSTSYETSASLAGTEKSRKKLNFRLSRLLGGSSKKKAKKRKPSSPSKTGGKSKSAPTNNGQAEDGRHSSSSFVPRLVEKKGRSAAVDDKGTPSNRSSQLTPVAKSSRPSFLCRSRCFQRMCDNAFDLVDADKSGSVDEKELYGGLLLIHLKLGAYAGPAACQPLDRERCRKAFELMDVDKSGTLDRDEFRQVMTVLFGNVLLRVLVLWSMTIMVLPMISKAILDFIYWMNSTTCTFIANLDEHSWIANKIELTIEGGADYVLGCIPDPTLAILARIHALLMMVPTSVWDTVPLAVITTILGTVVVPWLLFKIDEYFHSVANSKSKHEISKTKSA